MPAITKPSFRLDLNIGTTWLLPSWSTGPVGDEQAILEAAKAAGYRGVQGADAGRCLALGLVPTTSDIIQTGGGVRERAQRWVDAGYVCSTLMLGTGVEDDDTAARLVEEVLDASSATRLPIYVETHRATATQDLWRTLQLVDRFPEIRFNGDFSHWYTAHDLATWDFQGKLELIEPVLRRTRYLHGRIGTSGCIQVDVGDGSSEGRPHVEHFRAFWSRVAERFIADAALDPIPPAGLQLGFAPELLPAEFGYARQITGADGSLTDEGDRWTQALVLGRIAADCFETVAGRPSK